MASSRSPCAGSATGWPGTRRRSTRQVLLPGLFVLVVVWLGARFAIAGEITAGQLVAFYGYTAFLVIPLRTATEMVDRATRAHIGAGKLTTILRVEPDDSETPDAQPLQPGPARINEP